MTRKAVLWVLFERGAQQILLFSTLFIIARIIGPEQFGLFSLTQMIPTLCTMVLLGLSDGIIARAADDDESISTVFWSILATGAVFSLATLASGPLISSILGDDRLTDVVSAMSLVPVLSALSTVPTVIVQKKLDFKYFALRSILSSLVGGAVGIGVAVSGGGAVSIALQLIAQQVVANIVIWPSSGWTPKFLFSRAKAWHMMSPGSKLTMSYVIETLDQQLPRYFISLAFGAATAGQFAMATRIWALMREVFILPVSMVLFPSLARISRERIDGFGNLINGVLPSLYVTVVPAIAFLAYDAGFLFVKIFGPAWAGAGGIAQAYLIGCVAIPTLVVVRTSCRVRDLMLPYVALQAVALVGSCAQFFIWNRFGVVDYVLAYSVWNIACALAIVAFFKSRTEIDAGRNGTVFVRILLVSASAIVVAHLANVTFGFDGRDWLPFIAINLVGLCVLAGGIVLLGMVQYLPGRSFLVPSRP
ncbi:oligosaccharide flippase family protein [Sphingomonas dokdonensis]|uniref:Lipopolysaccharide biosynthesis protein WzxC n=1 Tax=Sphingomonas dokdonensis TaxID=344880 RepID=A0A245ZKZ6_9SPHN|nr:oligosaccharide flippase family protein [Sphingomonas dokdonensis]OWK30409.1 lipopolysaccharide biosynthesis protein WzxC [Sphingomonas dokdonensis]